MSVSHKYRTFDQLLEDVTVDFRTYALEGMIEPQQLIKVAMRVNYDLGLKINRTKDYVIDIENGKGKLPTDFNTLNYASICGTYTVNTTQPSGTHVEEQVPYNNEPTLVGACTVEKCGEELKLVQKTGPQTYSTYDYMVPLNIKDGQGDTVCKGCPTYKGADRAELKDGFIITNFTSGKVYINYQGAMEDEGGNLLVLDHPYCNEYYEYAIKQRILENMVFAGENVVNQLSLIENRLRGARNNALSFVNTPDFAQLKRLWEKNRKAQYHKYFNMFKSQPTRG